MSKKDLPLFNFAIPEHKRHVKRMIDGFDGIYRVEFSKVKDQRSLAQNAYLHGVVFPEVAEGIREAWGEECDSDRAKRILKDYFLRRPICDANGEIRCYEEGRSTADLSKEECSRFIEEIIQFSAEYLHVEITPASHYGITVSAQAEPRKAG